MNRLVSFVHRSGPLKTCLASFSNNIPSTVRIVEVGPRDGLQNEKQQIDTKVKIELINKLTSCGLSEIETTSFVSPKKIPQMADGFEVFKGIDKKEGVGYPVLVPNMRGYERAMEAGVKEIAVFASASESFSSKNINCTIEDSLKRFVDVFTAAKRDNVRVRGYLSCVVGCPYEGRIKPETVADIAKKLFDMGCYELSLGDTIGVGTPASITEMLTAVKKQIPTQALAGHFHDTFGQGLVNIYASLQAGVSVFDSSVSGLGGCPYARGATGNVATEDVVYMLNGLGVDHGVDLEKLVDVSQFISESLNRSVGSRVGNAILSKRKHDTKSDTNASSAASENRE